MQILNRRKKDEFIKIEVERVWQDNAGTQIGLTPSGDYITLDGELVEDPRHFTIMPVTERKKAEKWWSQLKDKREAEAKAGAEGIVPEEEPSQEQQPSAEESAVGAAIGTALNAIQQQQQEFLKALAATLAPTAPEAPSFKALYSCRKGKSAIIKPPKDWNELGFEEQPEWWGKQELVRITDDDVEYVYKRFFVPDEGGGE